MAHYRRLEGDPGDGEIVVRIVREGEALKAFITGLSDTGDPAEETVYSPEEMAPDEAFRIVENKRQALGNPEVRVMMEPDIEWNREWGTLEGA